MSRNSTVEYVFYFLFLIILLPQEPIIEDYNLWKYTCLRLSPVDLSDVIVCKLLNEQNKRAVSQYTTKLQALFSYL